jgi:adenylate kinase family enzyme
MASLHKDPRGKSPFFFCAFTDANGVRRFKSTKETKRKRAQAVAAGWQKAVDLSKRGTLTQVQASKVVSEIYESVNQEPLNNSDTESFFRDRILFGHESQA